MRQTNIPHLWLSPSAVSTQHILVEFDSSKPFPSGHGCVKLSPALTKCIRCPMLCYLDPYIWYPKWDLVFLSAMVFEVLHASSLSLSDSGTARIFQYMRTTAPGHFVPRTFAYNVPTKEGFERNVNRNWLFFCTGRYSVEPGWRSGFSDGGSIYEEVITWKTSWYLNS